MQKIIYIILFWNLIPLGNHYSQQIMLNEIMSSNVKYILDEDGDYSDWIEFYNNSSQTISLFDFGLSDDKNNPFKWKFPNVKLAPKEVFVVYASGKNKNEWFNNWETIINHGDNWEYQIGNENIPLNWFTPDYNSNWNEGPSGFGYGDGDDATIIDSTAVSVYIKKEFDIANVSDIQTAILHIDYDDGFVAYLNGIEIARSNLGTAGEIVPHNTLALSSNEANIAFGKKPQTHSILNTNSIFTEGKNVIAIQVHNATTTSSDLTAIPFLSISRKSTENQPSNTPKILENIFTNLHTNFKISIDGEEIILTNRSGYHEDAVIIPQLSSDVTYGRSIDASQVWGIFLEPTPWEVNYTEIYSEISDKPDFSEKSGFYKEPFFLEFDNVIGDIYYTKDGSVPDTSSTFYGNSIFIDKTTVIRARLYNSNNTLPSSIETKTFFINENTDLPVVSVSTNPENLWDYKSGIYVLGPNASEEYPYDGANYWQDWEIPIHIEMFETDGDKAFGIEAGAKIHGGWSRTHAQKSLSVFARGKYGNKEINHKIFIDRKIENFNSLILRSSGSDWDNTMIRDGFMNELVKNTSLDFQAHRPSLVFLNGEYWGIHNIREKINEDYLFMHHNIDQDNADIIVQNGYVSEGNDDEYWSLISFFQNNDLSVNENYSKLKKIIDVDNFIEYYTAEIFFDNTDWPGNNIKMWRERSDSARWRMILYDSDFGFGLLDTTAYSHNTLEFATATDGQAWPNPPWSTFILRKLLENHDFRNDFINQFSRYFNTSFSQSNVDKVINKFKKQIEDEMPSHINRWDTFTFEEWEYNINRLNVFNHNRINYLNEYIISKFDLPGTASVDINISDSDIGKIIFDGIEIKDSSWHGEYFEGTKVEIIADPKKNYQFSHWDGDINSSNPILKVTLSAINNFTAVFKHKLDSSIIVINEINYNSSPEFDSKDWIELFNTTADDIDISGWMFKDSEVDNIFTTPYNTVIKSNNYIVLTQDSIAFKSHFPEVKNYLGNIPFGLNKDGESIYLYNETKLIDSVKYNDKIPWPTKPDGKGNTLELVNFKLDNNNPENWKSSNFHGTPGRINDRSFESFNENHQQKIKLFQNYPNPFNHSTIVTYSLRNDEKIKLEIFDILGRKVKTLKYGMHKKGLYSEYWNGTNDKNKQVSSGLYFSRLQSENFVDTKKIIFLR